MEIYHTSPVLISEIKKGELFDDCLFFSTTPYFMCASAKNIYSLTVGDDEYVDARDLEDDTAIANVIMAMDTHYNVTVDADQAYDILTESGFDTAFDLACDIKGDGDSDYGRHLVLAAGDGFSDFGWAIQVIRAKCAVAMGYKGCIDEDEQGEVYIVPMFGRESELVLQSDSGELNSYS